ncbi:MAG TPA: hypothetical protein VGX94_04215 [Terriglobia bacterium]|nr:hypothetical protein [Terriglobia bacterium]
MSHPHRHRYDQRGHSNRVPRTLWVGFVVFMVFGVAAAILMIDPALLSQGSAGSLWQSAIAFGHKSMAKTDGAAGHDRVIYPYSIVAGGIHNKAEFEEAMKTDPVAAAHYADFNASKFHLVKLQKPEYAYVSFRVGDNVYWTSHKVELRQGETLISDGKNLGRTRCGNRVCETPRLPTYDHEPSEKDLNTPSRGRVETEAFNAVAPLSPDGPGVIPGPGSLVPPSGGGSSTPTGGIGGVGPMISSPPAGCASNTKADAQGDCITSRVSVPPPAQTPEDNTWVLLLSGGLVMAGYGWARRRRTAETRL